MQLTGFHHLTAITADAAANLAFFTGVLGLRLAKRTVNQDDVSAYHLYYSDGAGSPGSEITFFEWPVPPEKRGTNSITRIGFRVAGEDELAWWRARLAAAGMPCGGIAVRDGRATLDFESPEGHRLRLEADGGVGPSHPWAGSTVPPERQIRGLGAVAVSVPRLQATADFVARTFGLRPTRRYDVETGPVHVFEMGEGGTPDRELHVVVEPDLPQAQPGAGAVHHVAFRTPDDASHRAWADRMKRLHIPCSRRIDRFYFRSLYLRDPNGILFEIATDEPGLLIDEPLERLGETLTLPPSLESRREGIVAGLRPLP